MVTFGGCQATISLLQSENRGKELSIFLAFPVQTIFQIADGSQIAGRVEFFFIKDFQLINTEGMTGLENHHSATPNAIMDIGDLNP